MIDITVLYFLKKMARMLSCRGGKYSPVEMENTLL
jgi:hypothetical protein